MRALLIRLALLAILMVASLYAETLMSALGMDGHPASRALGRDILHSLIWLTGAIVAIAAIDLFFWNGVVVRVAKRPVPGLLKSAFALIVLLVAVTIIIGVVFERDVTAIWATSGAIGLVLGFALRNMIQDVFMGIALNLDGSIKAGDWVSLHHRDFSVKKYGQVLDITWRTSRIRQEDNNVVVVPNSMMGTMAVTNFALDEHVSRLETEIVIDFDVPPERARRILLAGAEAATAAPGIQSDPPPSVVIGETNERGVAYEVRFWGRVTEASPAVMLDSVMGRLLSHLRVAGLTPAYPKEDVYHAGLPKRLLEHDSREDRIEVLSRVPLFGQTMSDSELDTLAEGIIPKTWEAGQALVREGEPGDSMFVVVEGTLDVMVRRSPANGAGDCGSDLRVARIGAGEIFGEMSLLTGECRSASIVAATGAVVYEVLRGPLESILAERPSLAERISELVADRRVRTDEAMSSASGEDFEKESRRLKLQILERMKSVFVLILGAPEPSRPRRG